MCEIIGKKKEIAELKRYYESGRAEFVLCMVVAVSVKHS